LDAARSPVQHRRELLGLKAMFHPESLDQCLECAMVAVMAELDIEHVVGDGLGLGRRCVTENEFGFRINEFPDDPGRGDTIDFGSCPGSPDLAAVICGWQPFGGCGFLGRGIERVAFSISLWRGD
jgi:hypothetical protein